MTKEIYVDIKDKCSISILKDNVLIEYLNYKNEKYASGTIVKGLINSKAPSLNAVFVDINDNKTGFLQMTHNKYKINEELIVQIKKEKIEDKGVSLSDVIYIAGKYCVIGRGKGKNGISAKIKDDNERHRLKAIANEKKREGYFIVIRTDSKEVNEQLINEDINKVYEIFEEIEDTYHNCKKGTVLYKVDKITETLNNYFDHKNDTLITNDLDLYNEYFHKYPKNKNIELYTKDYDMFDFYNITSQINDIQHKKIWLKSGGSILIEYTDAMTVIDVNSGKNNLKGNKEETFLKTNIEAAIEAAKQIRLRNIGGIIIIDFIKGNNKKIQNEISNIFDNSIKEDKLLTTVGGFTKLGLFEVVRQKKGSKI